MERGGYRGVLRFSMLVSKYLQQIHSFRCYVSAVALEDSQILLDSPNLWSPVNLLATFQMWSLFPFSTGFFSGFSKVKAVIKYNIITNILFFKLILFSYTSFLETGLRIKFFGELEYNGLLNQAGNLNMAGIGKKGLAPTLRTYFVRSSINMWRAI